MVQGESITIHRRLSGDRFNDVVNVGGIRLRLQRNGSYTRNVLSHAEKAAAEADSDTCGLDNFQLPYVLSIQDSETVLVGYKYPNEYLRDCAVKNGSTGVVVGGSVFEAGFDSEGMLLKLCFRYPYDERHDQIGVVQTRNEKFVTAWINGNEDSHRTLDKGEYDSVEDVMVARSRYRTV